MCGLLSPVLATWIFLLNQSRTPYVDSQTLLALWPWPQLNSQCQISLLPSAQLISFPNFSLAVDYIFAPFSVWISNSFQICRNHNTAIERHVPVCDLGCEESPPIPPHRRDWPSGHLENGLLQNSRPGGEATPVPRSQGEEAATAGTMQSQSLAHSISKALLWMWQRMEVISCHLQLRERGQLIYVVQWCWGGV